MKLPAQDRYAPSAIVSRPDYSWPNGRRLAVLIFTNIEHHAFRSGLGSDSAVPGSPQTQRNYAWRDYGNRVGIWNILSTLDKLGLPAAHNCNSAALDLMPEIGRALVARGDEFIGHGRTNAERQDGLWEDDERRLIQQSRDGIATHAGVTPRGWLGPWLAQGATTLDLLKEEGFEYVMDWPADDQPFWMRTRSGPILSIPYSIEMNDSPAMVFRQHSGRDFADMVVDQFDEMLEQSRERPLVLSLVLHTFVIGQPFRLRPFRAALNHILGLRDQLWITKPADLAAHVRSLPPGIVPGSELLAQP